MKVLFLHNKFPEQFTHIAGDLVRQGHDVAAISFIQRPDMPYPWLKGVRQILVPKPRTINVSGPDTIALNEIYGRAQMFARMMLPLKKRWLPDLVVAHPFRGISYYAPDVFPNAKLITYCEWIFTKGELYNFYGVQSDDNPERQGTMRLRGTFIAESLMAAHAGVSPTHWQKAQFPTDLRDKIDVIFDGIDTNFFSPGESDSRIGTLDLKEMPEIVTYTSRGMERSRGFPQFCRALPIILARRPKCHIIIKAGAGRYYSPPPRGHKTWLDAMKAELPGLFENPRVHLLEYGDYETYRSLLRHSSVHVYLTEPFVLSWSMLEAMSTGCLLVASDTSPVREVITDGVNGILTPFFDHEKLGKKICDALARRDEMKCIAENARQTVIENYSIERCMPKYHALFERLLNGSFQ